jgi:hypothetical protein
VTVLCSNCHYQCPELLETKNQIGPFSDPAARQMRGGGWDIDDLIGGLHIIAELGNSTEIK